MSLPSLPATSGRLGVTVTLVETSGFLAGGGETTRLAVLCVVSVPPAKGDPVMHTLWTGLTIQLMRASLRMTLC